MREPYEVNVGSMPGHQRAPVPGEIWQSIDTQLPLSRGPSSTAIPWVRRLLSNQLHRGSGAGL
jgi:hypothetical protein